MASRQCSNCGRMGHFRATCPFPKTDDLQHWKVAKAAHRRENPDEFAKMNERKEENKKWKDEGIKVNFVVLNNAVCSLEQTLKDLYDDLDVMGRPDEWKTADKLLTSLLPLIREIVHNGKGFKDCGRLKGILVDGDIFASRLHQLEEMCDKLVRRVKSFVNGTLGKLAAVNSRNNPAELLRFIYANHPPKRAFVFDAEKLNGSTLRNQLKKSMMYYHPDKQTQCDGDWRSLCEAISRCITVAIGKLD